MWKPLLKSDEDFSPSTTHVFYPHTIPGQYSRVPHLFKVIQAYFWADSVVISDGGPWTLSFKDTDLISN